jgi:hypothetical protein
LDAELEHVSIDPLPDETGDSSIIGTTCGSPLLVRGFLSKRFDWFGSGGSGLSFVLEDEGGLDVVMMWTRGAQGRYLSLAKSL